MVVALERIIELAGTITEDDFCRDWVKQDAIMRELEVLGEAGGRVSAEFTAAHPEIRGSRSRGCATN